MPLLSSTQVVVSDAIPRIDIDPYDDATLESPFAMFDQVRQAGPVVFMPRYGVFAMGRHRDVGRALKDWERFSSTSGAGIADVRSPDAWRAPSPILEVDPPDHTRVRTALQRILTPKVIREWREAFSGRAEKLIDDLVDAGPIDAVGDLAEVFVSEVFPTAIGWADSPERRDNLFLLGALNFDSQGPRNARLLETEAKAARIMDWNNQQMQRESLLPGGFGLKIYEAADRGEIAPEVAPLLIRSFLRGGLDTTSATIAAAIHYLAQAPDQYLALRADPKRIRVAFDEAMRLETPIQSICRLTMEDVDFGDGCVVSANNKIIVMLGAANRDPDAFEHPDVFDLNRKTQAQLALGNGVHMCIGQMIARMEGELILQTLAARVRTITPCGPVRQRLNNNLRSFDSVPVELRSA